MNAATWVALAVALAATATAVFALWQARAASSQAASARQQAAIAEWQATSAERQAASAERLAASSEHHIQLIKQGLLHEQNQQVSQEVLRQKKLAAEPRQISEPRMVPRWPLPLVLLHQTRHREGTPRPY